MSFDDDYRLSRRDLLGHTGATLATAATAAGAGCGGLPPLGSTIRYGSVEVPVADAPTFREWLPARSALPGSDGAEDGEHGEDVMVYAPPSADAPAWSKAGVARTFAAVRADYVGVHIDDVDVALATGFGDEAGGAVLLGDVDPTTVQDAVGPTPYEPDATDADYDLYTRSDVGRSVAVHSDGLVFADGPRAREIISTVVAAGRGDVPRRHEHDDDFATLTDSTGLRRWGWVWPGGVGNAEGAHIRKDTVGWATGFDHEGERAYFVQTWVFPPEYDLTEGRVKTALRAESRAGLQSAVDAEAVDVSVDGRVATIEMQTTPSVLTDDDEAVFLTPFVTWSGRYDGTAEQLTIRHEAGDPVRADWLRIAVGDGDLQPVDGQELGDRMEPGETLTVATSDAEPGATVHLVYEAPDGDSSATLFSQELL